MFKQIFFHTKIVQFFIHLCLMVVQSMAPPHHLTQKMLQWLLKNTYLDTTGNSIWEDIYGFLEQYICAAVIYMFLLLAHGFKWLFIKQLIHLVTETCCWWIKLSGKKFLMSIIIKLYVTGDTMNKPYIDLHSSRTHGFGSLAE